MRELNCTVYYNGTDILGDPMIVEPSYQQRLSSNCHLGIVEVSNIPTSITLEVCARYILTVMTHFCLGNREVL